LTLRVDNDDDWSVWRREWSFLPGITYLNHGSFGPPPRRVVDAQRQWQDALASEPMDFYVRELEPNLAGARARVAEFVGVRTDDLVFVENSTYGMNVVASSVDLRPGDEVVLTDHEYGAVFRIWQRACQISGARIVTAKLPWPIESTDHVVDAIAASFTPKTKLLICSHITSLTALVLPAEEICQAARKRGIAVCIDGPHALATLDLDLDGLDCDYYTASGHKWLSAPFGSGFLYVHPRAQPSIRPPILSWGRVGPETPERWYDEFNWLGTRDPSPFLTVPTAIEFLADVGIDPYRARCRRLVDDARIKIEELTQLGAITAGDRYVSMLAFPLPAGESRPLQLALRQRFGIEIPISDWQGRRLMRVSCHLYNRRDDLDLLVRSLAELLRLGM
jgi:isopenicillin-N epimerase